MVANRLAVEEGSRLSARVRPERGVSLRLALALVAVAGAAAAAARAAWPVLPNGDGLGYLKALVEGGAYPGHPGYVPLLGAVAGAVAAPADALVAARGVSLGALAIAAVATAAAVLLARRAGVEARGHVAGAVLAGVGLSLSAGALEAGADVESYAPALAGLAVALAGAAGARAATGARGIAVGASAAAIGGALAAWMHVENVLVVPALALALPARVRPSRRLAFLAIAGALAAAPFVSILLSGHLGAATHGFRYPLRAAAPLIALYGAGKALVWAPYPYEASWARVVALSSLGVAALAALLAIAVGGARRDGRGPLLGRGATLALVGLYGAVGVAFFASDAERWLLLLPLLWSEVGAAVAASPRARLAASLVVALLAVTDGAVLLPRARDRAVAERAARWSALLRDGDLVISPGHGADEYVGFVERLRLERVPLVYEAARLGGDRARLAQLLDERVARARREGRRVILLRLAPDGAGDDDPRGWKELALLGIDRAAARALLPPGDDLPLGEGALVRASN
jgi:hypothetical protein